MEDSWRNRVCSVLPQAVQRGVLLVWKAEPRRQPWSRRVDQNTLNSVIFAAH